MKTLRELLLAILRILRVLLTFEWVAIIARQLRRCRWRRRARSESLAGMRGHSRLRCAPVPERIYRRPDPLIYSQSYLMAQGMGVTWDNPDIRLFHAGVPVASSELVEDTEYRVEATIWNGSVDGPAIGMPVRFSYLDFGIGGAEIPLGETVIDLPAKAAPGHPAKAETLWRTPTTPGHYCLRVELICSDDANPANNLGQENTDVGVASSPARFRFPVRNPDEEPRRLRLSADAYEIPPPPPCPPRSEDDEDPATALDWPEEHARRRRAQSEVERKRRAAVARHALKQFPVPADWEVEFSEDEFLLEAGDLTEVGVEIQPPTDFAGRQPINVNAVDERDEFVGGVTLYVVR